MAKISSDMTINEVIKVDRSLAKILLQFGMHCIGCPHAMAETLAEAGAAHGVDVNEMVKQLNEAVA
ncbi:disulfide oxidoreductase [Clostridia bacterium]|nr:disulfide oxidoreductase [Clostridia bacterium]